MNSKYKITVSEPWDFESEFGQNLIVGNIIKGVESNIVLFKSDIELEFDGVRGCLLILKTRYADQNLKDLKVTVGGSLVLLDDYENYEFEFLERKSKYVLIGSLEKL